MSGLDLAPLPPGPFGCVYADPAWDHKAWSRKGLGRAPIQHYPTMHLEAIKAMPVRDIVAKDCHLFLWTTAPHLQQSFEVLEAWGFRYSSMAFTWVKVWPRERDALMYTRQSFAIGLGKTTRKNAEFCLLGRRGKPKRCAQDISELIIAPRREHSRKPDEARDRIERYVGDVPKLELFTRVTVPGWEAWGNEKDKFNAEA